MRTRAQLADLGLVDIEADDFQARFGEAQSQRQADIAQAQHADHGFAAAGIVEGGAGERVLFCSSSCHKAQPCH